MTELRELREKPFFDWPEADDATYRRRLRDFCIAATLVLVPVPLGTFVDLPRELPQLLLCSCIGGGGVTLAFALRLRVGWGYISGRLTERATYYEKNQRGWTAEKDDEAWMRDRLLDEYEVKPVLRRVDASLKVAAATLAALCLALQLVGGDADPNEQYSAAYLARLRTDDGLALREQRRTAATDSNRPAFCAERATYYKAMAGGGSCD